jgi:cardiolipin synthase
MAMGISGKNLLAGGVRIFEYLPRMFHGKTAVIDGTWATIGTANMDYRSLFLNYELNLITRDGQPCRQLQVQFEEDLTESAEIGLQVWEQRKWKEYFFETIGWLSRKWLWGRQTGSKRERMKQRENRTQNKARTKK